MSAAQDEPQGLCEDCFKGHELTGTISGTESRIGPFETYVAQPETNKDPAAAIIFFCDAMGWNLPNPKIMSDLIAKKTGLTVYCPDIFHGDGAPPDLVVLPATAQEVNNKGFFSKLWMNGKMLMGVPWFMRHRPAVRLPQAAEFIQILKTQKSHARLGAVGYCYGGKFAIHFNGTGDLAASVACHPSLLSDADIAGIKAPISFACAESDSAFGEKPRENAKAALKGRSFECEFVLYPNTVHGFAARPDLRHEDVRKGFEGALNQTCAFFGRHLVGPTA